MIRRAFLKLLTLTPLSTVLPKIEKPEVPEGKFKIGDKVKVNRCSLVYEPWDAKETTKICEETIMGEVSEIQDTISQKRDMRYNRRKRKWEIGGPIVYRKLRKHFVKYWFGGGKYWKVILIRPNDEMIKI